MMLAVLALVTLGLVVLYSASMAKAGGRFLSMQLLWAAVGGVACLVAALVDYRLLKRYYLVPVLYGVSLVLLTAVLIPGVGQVRGGAARWFDFGPVSFQPSELAKVALLVALAQFGERYRRQMGGFLHGLVLPALLVTPVVVLILLEPDYGNALMLGTVSAMVLLVAGIRWRWVLIPGVCGLLLVAAAIAQNPNRSARVEAWIASLSDPEKARGGINDQAWEGVKAMGNGGWTGVGLGKGRQKYGFVPEHRTDFIFTMLGEELGLAATIGVVLALLVVVISGVTIAWNARDTFGLLLGSGLTFMIGLQALINLGVVTMVLPNKGMPLPFLSYGGSNLLMMLTSVGVLLSIAHRAAVGAAGQAATDPDGAREVTA